MGETVYEAVDGRSGNDGREFAVVKDAAGREVRLFVLGCWIELGAVVVTGSGGGGWGWFWREERRREEREEQKAREEAEEESELRVSGGRRGGRLSISACAGRREGGRRSGRAWEGKKEFRTRRGEPQRRAPRLSGPALAAGGHRAWPVWRGPGQAGAAAGACDPGIRLIHG